MPQKTEDTPMMQQYYQIKNKYPDAFLFYRVGDFYELFQEDAIKGSQVLELTLTARNKNADEPIPMCGVPYHAADNYIQVLVENGYKVAICEQVETPAEAEGTTVKREVIKVVTPGTMMDVKSDNANENNYITSVAKVNDEYGIAYADLSTGEVKATHIKNTNEVLNELLTLNTKESVLSFEDLSLVESMKKLGILVNQVDELTDTAEVNYVIQELTDDTEKQSAEYLISYLVETQKRSLSHLKIAQSYETNSYLQMDYSAQDNLELFKSLRTGKKYGSLLWLLDETKTAMGGRLLKQWIARPIIDKKELLARQDKIQILMDSFFQRASLQDYLTKVYDLERLAGRIAYGTVNGRDLLQLKTSLGQVPLIQEIIRDLDTPEFIGFADQLDGCSDIYQLIDKAVIDDAPISIKDGGVIKDGFNAQLDEYRDASRNGKQWIADLQAKEQEVTGIHTLKVGFNKVFGYYIEVTKANVSSLPEGRYERKQTLTNAERYITPELKEKERIILEAEEKSNSLEYELFTELRETIKNDIKKLQNLALKISELDILQSLATIAENYHLIRPEFSDERVIDIVNGRHPVVEKVLGQNQYIPNDVKMGVDDNVMLITGPNMSGKSTYMRQMALTAIMAQVGSFIPADSAILPIFDHIFTRIGAADDLISGDSTFMVEMKEANDALKNATKNSLLVFDEIGRGTATYDGMALAQSIIEYIENNVQAKTMFSTHYHELTQLDDKFTGVNNVHVNATEENGTLVFLHKVLPGPSDQSYGIHVAKLAGLPPQVLIRAEEVLNKLEADSGNYITAGEKTAESQTVAEPEVQMSLFSEDNEITNEIKETNLMDITPMDAMNLLYKWQKELKE
ncbi:DNA mismatch repair protein MutS [Companilactobacillus sp. RD055328]|uniref:DNA mismatch repair protein MutS n=1 Tax=Companilactobacillus sp. RD055328 TaxID=2916634 RepID=UPI001FC894C0|nr:DNA mismatch repair protein MutS [Companilactobacillus sp. RD055328]GKQ42123.1 DNA mismatch repair protein MutS [Companilactobacillus sp. RD055328]